MMKSVFVLWCSALAVSAAPSFLQTGNLLVMSNANVQVQYHLDTGTADFYWQNVEKITSFYSAVTNGNGGNYIASTSYPVRNWAMTGSTEVVVTNSGGGLPTMLQYFTLDQDDSFLVRVSLSASTNLQSRWMAPVVVNSTGGVDLGSYNDDRALFVPFDNDHFVSYNSESINGSDTGNEVGAFYDNTTRNGLVVGSVTHNQWKTGVHWSGSNNRLNQLQVFGGLSDYWTWDVMPHGLVSGTNISSPAIFVGFGNDWRTTMDNFADENTKFAPPLVWTNGVPFGWNSWGVIQTGINYTNAVAVSDAIHTNLQNHNFTNGGTVYVNLDSYWNNLWDDWNGSKLQSFVAHCHANGQKAGVYFTPFAFWGNASDATNYWVPVGYPPNYSLYRFSDILLRDANGHPIANDGALALDPTHPGTRGYINYYAYWFKQWGFDYVKLDFLSLGALEGVHYDPNVTTGIEAYNQGMQYLLNQFGGKMFISESIAPIFPYQYADSRRIACDAQGSRISDVAYTMNAVSCGWWIDRLYPFNDPDLMVFGNGANANENQSRLINCAITGVFLDGDSLTNAASRAAAQSCLTNRAINDVARLGKTFRPVDGATGTGAADILEQPDGRCWDIAVFNYYSSTLNKTVDLNSAGLPPGVFAATNLWDGTTFLVTNSFNVSLNAKQAKLFRLALVSPPPSPRFNSAVNAGAGGCVFSGTNGIPGWDYYLLASTNLALPATEWTIIATNAFNANGGFNFNCNLSPGVPQMFYRLQMP